MSNQQMAGELQRVLADTYALYLKTQNYHWNVEGPHFKPLHELFEEHYTDLAEAIDVTAEHIRALGPKVDGRFSAFQEHNRIGDGNNELKADAMVKDLAESHKKITASIKEAMDVASESEDIVLEDFFTQRLQFHRKAIWMLESSI